MPFNPQAVFHFDVFADFAPLLHGQQFAFPLRESTLTQIANPGFAQVVTIKSSSSITASVLAAFPNLKLLVTRTVGMDHIDQEACVTRGINIRNIPDYGAFGIAEHVFALILSQTRKILVLNEAVRNGQFSSEQAQGYTLEGKILGVIGAGRIGLEIIKLAKAFKMSVLAFDMFPNLELATQVGFEYGTMSQLLLQADVISLNVPLTEQTRGLINQREIEQMREGVILINTSRGGVLNTEALINQIGKFKYVGLDVLEDEHRFSADHPLLHFPNVVITPHCAFYTDKSTQLIAQKTMAIIEEEMGEGD